MGARTNVDHKDDSGIGAGMSASTTVSNDTDENCADVSDHALKVLTNEHLRKFKRYPVYRDSGIGWLGEIPEHWEAKRMKLIAPSRINNLTVKSEGSVYVGLENIESWTGRLLLNHQPENIDSVVTSFSAGDVLFGKLRPYLAKAGRATFSGVCTSEIVPLRPNKGFSQGYLTYSMLNAPYIHWLDSLTFGARMPRLSPEQIDKSFMLVPSEPEQEAITTFLDCETAKIDALITKKQRLIALFREKRSAVIGKAAMGDPASAETKLGYRVDLLAGHAFPSNAFSIDVDDIRLLRGANISPEGIVWDDTVLWPFNDAKRFGAYALREGDLVFGMDRPWISTGMRVAVVTASDVPSLLLQRVARLRAKAGLSQEYLKVLLSSPQFRAYFESVLTGISVPHVSPEQILSFRARFPRFHVQHETAKQVDCVLAYIKAMSDLLERSVSLLQDLRISLISAAVNGKIDVREEVA
jgi:type I restriction enzyme S subunit